MATLAELATMLHVRRKSHAPLRTPPDFSSTREVSFRIVRPTDLASPEWCAVRGSRLIVLFGSFLSAYLPTALPFGAQVSEQLSTLLFSELFTDPSAPHGQGKNWLASELKHQPFEALMQAYPDPAGLSQIIGEWYGSSVSNPIYDALARAAGEGIISGFATTNYDCALEAASTAIGDPISAIRTEREWMAWHRPSSKIPLLKLHGSAESGYEHSLVFELRREGVLESWKRAALHDLLQDATLIVLGFSGRDFDVWPELANSLGLRALYWIQPDRSQTSYNAKQALRRRNGTLVEADLLAFLPKLLGIDTLMGDVGSSIVDFSRFRPELFRLWQLRILDRMACRSVAEPLLASDAIAANEKERLQSSMDGHAGRYRCLAISSDRHIAAGADGIAAIQSLLTAAFGWLAYGRLDRAEDRLREAEGSVLRLAEPQRTDARIECDQFRLTYSMKRAQIAQLLFRRKAYRRYQDVANRLRKEIAASLSIRGELDRRAAASHNVQRLQLPHSDARELPAEVEYAALGLRSMEAIRARDWIRARPFWLSRERAAAARAWIVVADTYGWHHEAWKLRWILFWRCPRKLRSWNLIRIGRHLHATAWHFFRVEYAPLWRVFQAIYAVVPSGDSTTFDSEALIDALPSVAGVLTALI